MDLRVQGVALYSQDWTGRQGVRGDESTSSGSARTDGSGGGNGSSSKASGSVAKGDAGSAAKSKGAGETLDAKEAAEVLRLQTRDSEVRAHEQAHMAVGGRYIRGAASYEYALGPDNRRYAIGGEVSIDVSPVSGDPEATIQKMEIVKRAALAPADPSGADYSVAAAAESAAAMARIEAMKKAAMTAEKSSGASSGDKGRNVDTTA